MDALHRRLALLHASAPAAFREALRADGAEGADARALEGPPAPPV